MQYGKRTWRWQASAAAFSLALAACGGGGGDNTTEETSTQDPTTLQTVSGTVEAPSGVTLAERDLGDRVLAVIGSLVGPTQAEVIGLETKANVQVQVVKIDSNGEIAEVLATGTTDSNGDFSIDVDVEGKSDVVIVAGGSGGSGETIRAPAGGENIAVNPVSENIVRKVVSRVKSGDSSFDDFTATELATLVGIIFEELEAAGADFSGASSVDDAVKTADDSAGETDDQLVADAEGDSGIDLAGPKNMAGIGLELVTEADRTGRVGIDAEILPGTIGAGPTLELSGQTFEVFETNLSWSFTDASSDFSASIGSDMGQEGIPADEPAFPASVGNSGRLLVDADTMRRGGVSADGERFAFVGTAGAENNNYAQLVVGASEWSPGNVSETYNVMKFTPLVDASGGGDNFRPNTFAMYAAQLLEHTVQCSGGTCDIEGTATASTANLYAHSGPEGFRNDTGDVGTGGNPTSLTQAMTLNGDGTLTGTWSDGEVRGLLAPDARMYLLHYQLAKDYQYPGQSFYYGLPKGQSCDAGTFSGTYNMAGLAVSQFDGDDDTQRFDGAIETETLGFAAEVDGSSGTITVPDLSTVDTGLTFLDGQPMVSRGPDGEAGGDITYTMNADCTFTIASGGSGSASGDLSRVSTTGFVSPDGETVVIGDHSQEFDSGGSDNVFTQVLIGFRAPSN